MYFNLYVVVYTVGILLLVVRCFLGFDFFFL